MNRVRGGSFLLGLTDKIELAVHLAADLGELAFDYIEGRGLHQVRKEIEAEVSSLVEERDRLRKGLNAADSVMWMAERYAEAGGSHGIEMVDFRYAKGQIDNAYKKEPSPASSQDG